MNTETYNVNTVVSLIDTEATALIKGYAKGWYTVIINDEERKIRGNKILGPVDDSFEDDEEQTSGPVEKQMRKYRQGYEKGVSFSGNTSLNTGDELAHLLEGTTPEFVCHLAEHVCELDFGELVAKYEHLNPGQQRMNAGNRIRAAMARGDVTIEDIAKAAKYLL